jgi:NADH-quinone oxidoreductase subunit F
VIEGRKAWPRQKPPFPVTVGLYGKPTTVNNVETLANVPPIVLNGADWYRNFGMPESTGTMIFSLDDDLNRPGVYELPFGTPLRYLIEECGGGMKSGKKIKAIMPAAPSSAYLPAEKIDTPLDHNSMRDAGSALGCGVVRLVAEGTCIVEEVIKISEFFTAESCGQCPACRMETSTLTALLKKVQAGQGGPPILEQFGKVLAFNKDKGFCNLIAMPGPPIESALKLFPADFEAHLSTGKCPVN